MPKKPNIIKRWFIFCEPCSYKQIIKADKPTADNLVEIKRPNVPGGAPYLDPETKKTKTKPGVEQPKLFKCPKCGRGVIAKKLPDVYAEAYKAIDEDRRKKEEEAEKQRRIEDGKPHVRETDPDFMG